MAKRTKSPASNPGASPTSFQIPEVTPDRPSPWDEIAATGPSLPDEGGLTPSAPPSAPKMKPTLPTGELDFDPDAVERSKPNLLNPLLILKRPALGRMTTLGTALLGDCAIANALGTRDPIKALVTFSSDRKWLFLMPVNHKTNKGVKITYQRKQACINFWGPFEESGKIVPKGYREYYRLEITEEPITIHKVKGYALFMSLEEFKSEQTRPREESTGKADSTDLLPEADLQPDEYYEELLGERDARIKALETRLKEYEERFGKL